MHGVWSRCAIGAAALAVVCAAAALIPATHVSAQAPSLAGTTTITSSNSAYERVYLPAEATLEGSFTPSPGATISGPGRVTGVVLRRADAAATDNSLVAAISFNYCWSTGCTPGKPFVDIGGIGSDYGSAPDGSPILHAGSYDLYLISDGGPLAVTLTLTGLTGSVALQPSVPISPNFQQPAPLVVPGPATVISAGSANPVTDPGLIAAIIEMDGTEPTAGTTTNICHYNGPPPGGIYALSCPGAADAGLGAIDTPLVGTSPFSSAFTSLSSLRGGPWNVGGYIEGAQASVTDVHFVSVGLNFDQGAGGPAVLPELPVPAALLVGVLGAWLVRGRSRLHRS